MVTCVINVLHNTTGFMCSSIRMHMLYLQQSNNIHVIANGSLGHNWQQKRLNAVLYGNNSYKTVLSV